VEHYVLYHAFTHTTHYTAAQVPEHLLKDYVYKTLKSFDDIWAFKKNFTIQMALHSYLSYLLNIGERHLYKNSFNKHSGRVISDEFYPSYNEHFLIDRYVCVWCV
jgi:transformation/transcription domain-associated protein